MMSQIAEGWETVSCRNSNPLWFLLTLLQIAFLVPEVERTQSTATWTVRQTATGAVRKVTARTEQEAKDKIALGLFDDG
jgi:hypothetical protein